MKEFNFKILKDGSLVFLGLAKLIWHPFIKTWCGKPYPNHPKGCPNFNKKIGCPMNNKNIDEIINVKKPIYIFGIGFDLENHRRIMKRKHPDWTEKQCGNVLYWQKGLRKKLKKLIQDFRISFPNYIVDTLPEGHGVNITRMLLNEEVPYTWDYPLRYVWQIAIAGEPINDK